MEFKFSRDGENNLQPEPAAEKKNQSALLVLLLLLVGGFSYVYFFTGLINPQETSKSPEAPVTRIEKMPLPPREGDVGKADSKSPDVKREAAAQPHAESPKTVQPGEKLLSGGPTKSLPHAEPPRAAQTAPIPAAAQEAKKQKEPPAKPTQGPQKTAPPLSTVKKPAVADKKSVPAATDIKKVPAVAAIKPKAPPKPKKQIKAIAETNDAPGSWSIIVGSYLLEDALSTDMGRVRKAGFVPVVVPGSRKKTEMNRLFLAEFTDKSDAQAALNKLMRYTSDAFIIEQSGRHNLYAGSYLLDARAAIEMERLRAAGFPVVLKRVEVAIPSQDLTLGPFKTKQAADDAFRKLKAAGIKGALSRQ